MYIKWINRPESEGNGQDVCGQVNTSGFEIKVATNLSEARELILTGLRVPVCLDEDVGWRILTPIRWWHVVISVVEVYVDVCASQRSTYPACRLCRNTGGNARLQLVSNLPYLYHMYPHVVHTKRTVHFERFVPKRTVHIGHNYYTKCTVHFEHIIPNVPNCTYK